MTSTRLLTVAGAVLLDTLLKALGAPELTLCDFALREGLVLDYIKKNGAHIRTVERYPDVRRRSVVELAERCNYVPRHATQVAHLSLSLFDATQQDHGLGARLLLRPAVARRNRIEQRVPVRDRVGTAAETGEESRADKAGGDDVVSCFHSSYCSYALERSADQSGEFSQQ